MSGQQILTLLIEYVVSESQGRGAGVQLTADTSIVTAGLVDSLGLFKLIAFVEETFQVQIQPDEVVLENFETLNALRNMIQTKRTGYANSRTV